eukprot:scaffold276891_cov18-Prasinocladus_malaysianus.AAC.2
MGCVHCMVLSYITCRKLRRSDCDASNASLTMGSQDLSKQTAIDGHTLDMSPLQASELKGPDGGEIKAALGNWCLLIHAPGRAGWPQASGSRPPEL